MQRNLIFWEIYNDNNIQHHALKVYDSSLENLQKIEILFPLIHTHVSKNENVLIHCMAGISRSPSVILFYRMSQGFNYSDDIELFRYTRKINPNDGFRRQLDYYANEKKFLLSKTAVRDITEQ